MLIRNPLRFGPGQQMAAGHACATIAYSRIIGILAHPDNAGRIHRRSGSSRAANVTLPGRTRTQNSNRVANQQFWFARFALPRLANSSCP
jgi:hypothetical protein